MAEEKKKWKGKDWYVILAEEPFKGKELGEIPATDPKQIPGRTLEIGVDELTGREADAHMKIKFKVERLEDGRGFAKPVGFYLMREYLTRAVRKKTQKVEAIHDLKSQDGLLLHIKTQLVFNRNVYKSLQTSARKKVGEILAQAEKQPFSKFLLDVISGRIQKQIKKECSKIYPVRFAEIAKIELKKAILK
ncbi:MAG: hypothetical protein DRP12_03860 [Candidatus Aenigmatarchaeota archaeon]|nr:MAG: hypothetical protein DRP12_03860 [Candidatus Aenigmarchaeota archaeon]